MDQSIITLFSGLDLVIIPTRKGVVIFKLRPVSLLAGDRILKGMTKVTCVPTFSLDERDIVPPISSHTCLQITCVCMSVVHVDLRDRMWSG